MAHPCLHYEIEHGFTAIESGLANWTNELFSLCLANTEVSLEQSRCGMLFIQGGFSKFELLLAENRLWQQLLQSREFNCYFRNPKYGKTEEYGKDRRKK